MGQDVTSSLISINAVLFIIKLFSLHFDFKERILICLNNFLILDIEPHHSKIEIAIAFSIIKTKLKKSKIVCKMYQIRYARSIFMF